MVKLQKKCEEKYNGWTKVINCGGNQIFIHLNLEAPTCGVHYLNKVGEQITTIKEHSFSDTVALQRKLKIKYFGVDLVVWCENI